MGAEASTPGANYRALEQWAADALDIFHSAAPSAADETEEPLLPAPTEQPRAASASEGEEQAVPIERLFRWTLPPSTCCMMISCEGKKPEIRLDWRWYSGDTVAEVFWWPHCDYDGSACITHCDVRAWRRDRPEVVVTTTRFALLSYWNVVSITYHTRLVHLRRTTSEAPRPFYLAPIETHIRWLLQLPQAPPRQSGADADEFEHVDASS